MKKNKIKFIASDLDGTLLLNGAQKVSEELIPLIKRLNDEGDYILRSQRKAVSELKEAVRRGGG